MSETEEQENLRLKRKIRPKFHKALVVALIISLILAVMLIMFLSRYLSSPGMEENGSLDRTTPMLVTASGSVTQESHLALHGA
jgi:uncharacterized membrane protein